MFHNTFNELVINTLAFLGLLYLEQVALPFTLISGKLQMDLSFINGELSPEETSPLMILTIELLLLF